MKICEICVSNQGRLGQLSLPAIGQVDWLFELSHDRMCAMFRETPNSMAFVVLASVLLAAKPDVSLGQAADYRPGPLAKRQTGVPKGKIVQAKWTNCKHYPGTERDYWIYIPAQHDGSKPANLMVFQDSGGFVRSVCCWRTSIASG